jgi:hypothetical protein
MQDSPFMGCATAVRALMRMIKEPAKTMVSIIASTRE